MSVLNIVGKVLLVAAGVAMAVTYYENRGPSLKDKLDAKNEKVMAADLAGVLEAIDAFQNSPILGEEGILLETKKEIRIQKCIQLRMKAKAAAAQQFQHALEAVKTELKNAQFPET